MLRLEAPLGHPLSPGEQSLRIAISSGRREVTAADFAINVKASDLPALAQQRAVLDGVSVALKPGRTKGVRAMLRNADADTIQSGVAVVRWQRDSGEQRLPLSILNAEPGPPSLEVSDIVWHALPEGDAFTVRVTNESDAYRPITGQLTVGGRGRFRLALKAGYERWLAPGETATLAFSPGVPVPAGDYGLILEIHHREVSCPS